MISSLRKAPWASDHHHRGPVAGLLGGLTLALTLLLASCGGVGTGGTGTYAAGPITGLGSIFVAGVKFDDSAALVRDDDGAALSASALQLGVTVEVEGAVTVDVDSTATARAWRVTAGSEMVGPVTMIDSATGVMRVLGQVVRTSAGTAFSADLPGGLSAVTAGAVVRVFGLYDASAGAYLATRIESAVGAPQWRLRGPVSAVDTAAQTLRIGQATLAYGTAAEVPVDLAALATQQPTVRLRLVAGSREPGVFQVLSFAAPSEVPAEAEEFRVSGTVTSFTSASRFSVGGVDIDASAATVTGLDRLKLGALAQVRGPARGGIVQAVTVLLPEPGSLLNGFAFEGPVERLDVAAQTLVIKGSTIWFGRPTPAELQLLPAEAKLSDLAVGRQLRIRAVNANGRLEAVIIKF